MEKFQTSDIPKSPRIQKLVDALYEHMPVIESARAKLITESYKETEGEPIITRRAKAFAHILHNIPIIIRDNELIVGSSTIAPRGCQTFPEFSYEWLEAELDTVATRTADPFEIAEETKAELKEADKYWKGKTTSELATSYMAPEAIKAIEHNIFTPGNYFYNGVGHVTVKYWEVLETGFEGIMEKARKELDGCSVGDGNYARKSHFGNPLCLFHVRTSLSGDRTFQNLPICTLYKYLIRLQLVYNPASDCQDTLLCDLFLINMIFNKTFLTKVLHFCSCGFPDDFFFISCSQRKLQFLMFFCKFYNFRYLYCESDISHFFYIFCFF